MTERAERAAIAPGEYGATRSAIAWTGEVLAAIAVVLGVAALWVGPNWTLMWVAVVLLVLAVVTRSVLRRLGIGQF
jgi:hypothetical protein